MKNLSLLCSVLTGLLTLSACGDTVNEMQISADQAQVQFIHGDYQQANSKVQFAVDNMAAGEADYGQSGGYLAFGVGSHTVKMTAGAATGTAPITVSKNNSHSFFATPASTTGSIGGQLVPDDQTLPPTGQARIRLVNLTANLGVSLQLAVATTAGGQTVYQSVVGDDASFTNLTPATTSLVLLDANNQPVTQAGSNGVSIGTKKYEAGRLYTAVAVGNLAASGSADKLKVFLLVNP